MKGADAAKLDGVRTWTDLDPDWPVLWGLAEELADARGCEPETVFDEIGLLLCGPDDIRWGYDVTPASSVTFAHTGGDGVHYGLLHDETARIGAAVVMTVPMADQPHFIVGTSLRDFLMLGCRTGYFSIEGLAYDDDTIAWLQAGDDELSGQQVALLGALTHKFDLRPWPDVAARLADLRTRLLSTVRCIPR